MILKYKDPRRVSDSTIPTKNITRRKIQKYVCESNRIRTYIESQNITCTHVQYVQNCSDLQYLYIRTYIPPV